MSHQIDAVNDALDANAKRIAQLREALRLCVDRLVIAHNAHLGAQDHHAIHAAEEALSGRAGAVKPTRGQDLANAYYTFGRDILKMAHERGLEDTDDYLLALWNSCATLDEMGAAFHRYMVSRHGIHNWIHADRKQASP